MKLRMHQIGGAFLAFIMTLYLGCVITQTHAHVINGAIVVHSHPDYWGDDDASSRDDHTTTELVFYHQVSNLFSCVGGFFSPIVPEALETLHVSLYTDKDFSLITAYPCTVISLRAPPMHV
ncbi:hypothetical protein [Porphyromonas cangingivalis]|uniref:hypothetical protein n=1 Tax=Porphyromonas cangingivalis TaxID=36874 RepID=UPI00243204B3|nr:hypothetical protein [Porphyromonas cangingivalis]